MMSPSASAVAADLNEYMRAAGPNADNEHIRAMMDWFCSAPCHTPEDALALAAWTSNFLGAALNEMPEPAPGEMDNARFFVGLSRALTLKAITALEATTGTAAESYNCEFPTWN